MVSASFKKKRSVKPKFVQHIRTRWIVLFGIVVLLIGGGCYFAYLSQPALRAGNYSLSRREYNMLLTEAKQQGVSKYTARNELQKSLAARSAADKLGITYLHDKAALTRQAITSKKLTVATVSDYDQFTAYPSLIARYVALGEKGGYEVAYVNFPFARYIFGFAGEDKGDPKLYRNTEALHADIAYAKQQAELYRRAYLDKSKTLSDIVRSVRQDGRLTYGQASNQSDIFILEPNQTKDPLYASGNTVSDTLFQEITKTPVGQPTDIHGELWANDESLQIPEIKHGDFMDAAYYFFVVQQKVTARSGLHSQYDKLVQGYMQ